MVQVKKEGLAFKLWLGVLIVIVAIAVAVTMVAIIVADSWKRLGDENDTRRVSN